MLRSVVIISLLSLSQIVWSQLDADFDKPYNEVTFLGTHNAFNSRVENFIFPNQKISVYDQLQGGIRGLCLDIYQIGDTLYQYHAYPMLRTQKLSEDLGEIKQYLEEDSTAIITLFLESYVSSGKIDTLLTQMDLSKYLFSKDTNQVWPTCREMISNDTRLVIFSGRVDKQRLDWYHHSRIYVASTDYSNFTKASLSTDFHRGDETKDIYVMNHFVYDCIGTGSWWRARRINKNKFLRKRCAEMKEKHGKYPNFILIDFFREGDIDLKEIVD